MHAASPPGTARAPRVRGRHHLDGSAAVMRAAAVAEAVAFDVEAQVGLACVFVGAVAREAGLREDRSDVGL